MNKRIRKKQFKRTLRGLVAAYNEYEAARERIFRKAIQDLADEYAKYVGSRETVHIWFRHCMETASLMASSGPLSRFLQNEGTA